LQLLNTGWDPVVRPPWPGLSEFEYEFDLGIAIPEVFSNPEISGLKNANPGIPGLNPVVESLILN